MPLLEEDAVGGGEASVLETGRGGAQFLFDDGPKSTTLVAFSSAGAKAFAAASAAISSCTDPCRVSMSLAVARNTSLTTVWGM